MGRIELMILVEAFWKTVENTVEFSQLVLGRYIDVVTGRIELMILVEAFWKMVENTVEFSQLVLGK
jgi:hypothetical protein